MRNIIQKTYLKKRLGDVEAYLDAYLDFQPSFISDRAQFNFRAGGKRLRPAFVLLAADYFGNYNDDVIRTAAVMELIHMSSLIHDDINDNAHVRRGQITINSEYDNDVAAYVGDYILIKALRHVYGVNDYKRVLSIIVDTAIEIAKGEVAQLHSMFDLNQTMEDYLYRIERKTALLIAICCQLGALLSGASKEEEAIFYEYGYHLGLAFQMKDDLLDIMETAADLGKPTGKDLESGLLNLPTLLLLNKSFAEKEMVCSLIEQRFPQGQADVSKVVAIIKREGCIEESEAIIRDHVKAAKNVLEKLPERPLLELMRQGADYVYERAY